MITLGGVTAFPEDRLLKKTTGKCTHQEGLRGLCGDVLSGPIFFKVTCDSETVISVSRADGHFSGFMIFLRRGTLAHFFLIVGFARIVYRHAYRSPHPPHNELLNRQGIVLSVKPLFPALYQQFVTLLLYPHIASAKEPDHPDQPHHIHNGER